ncbi:ubiquitin-conjugating enzyme E2 [Chondrus crispus]|uniref:Ubiquitin-conjugating enzyme E2 n=1 Tax=Chondrus crispus TaxID=2769 RepID=R7Q2J9_CHOCR|nr:ubiquitin-conjugating enzyme E2 [Chondrus crispus]CDF32274.1 ubiquitin-conjugating enzyme E2 [Chondrus crispus]|eukprot:XP_005711939.1 ubiquitin-conjugating enzyme E2 [Chondrus crispus]
MSSQNQVAKRLQTELMQLMMDPISGVSAFPDGDDLTNWKGTVEGADNGVYADMQFTLSMAFPQNYPMAPPTVKFETPIFHPNIDMSGNICLDILKDKWSATYTVTTLLLSIQGLLETPNNDSPLNNQAAELWHNKGEFLVLAKRRYANLPIN